MTNDDTRQQAEEALSIMEARLATLPPDTRKRISQFADILRMLVIHEGAPSGPLAVLLVSTEFAARRASSFKK